MIHCYEFYASPVISKPRYFELFFPFPLGLRNSGVRLYNFFLPKECQITLALDLFYYIDVHIFDSKLVKNAFTPCRVPFRGFCVF